MPETEKKSYSSTLKEIETVLRELEKCDDVDRAVDLFERGKGFLEDCKQQLDHAKQRFENINTS